MLFRALLVALLVACLPQAGIAETTLQLPLLGPATSSLNNTVAKPGAVGGFQIVATTTGSREEVVVGDTDNDSLQELIVIHSSPCRYEILERTSPSEYSSVLVSTACIHPYAAGDLDRDGRAEIIGQLGYNVQIMESADAASHPTNLVWSSPAISNIIGEQAVGDTDQDGNMEILHSGNSWGGGKSTFHIFENVGDNEFIEVFVDTIIGNTATGVKVIGFFDTDEQTDIVISGLNGRIVVYESGGDDNWALVWSTQTDLINAYAVAGGEDTDGNGRPEFFVAGSRSIGGVLTWVTEVYEENCNNSYHLVATLLTDHHRVGIARTSVANVDDDAQAEYLLEPGRVVLIYKATQIGVWEIAYEIPAVVTGARTADLDDNGISEVIMWTPFETWILEHTSTASAQSIVGDARLQIMPNPTRGLTLVAFDQAVESASEFLVFNAAGRMVQRRTPASGARSIAWTPGELPTGMYYFRLKSATMSESRRGRVLYIK